MTIKKNGQNSGNLINSLGVQSQVLARNGKSTLLLLEIEPDLDRGIYPFKDIKLSRADIEWLLSTHDNNRGPVDWNDERQREREGLDLRGADLRGVDLHGLPLARIIAGPRFIQINEERYEEAKIHLEGADLYNAHLEGADLYNAHLEGARLRSAYLEKARLFSAHLGEADLSSAHLEGADLGAAHLEGAHLDEAFLKGAELVAAHLEGVLLAFAHLEGADLSGVFFDRETNLEGLLLSNNENVTASLSDILWGDVNVALVDWSTISTLGDENEAKDNKSAYGYGQAERAYRQLSVVLRNQGLNEDASRFAYRAQLMQRKVFWYKRKYLWGKMRDADMECKVATRPFQHRLLLFAMPMASRLHFFRLSATLTHGRKVRAENTFCPESGERGLGS